jgi:hypothetical protein
VFLLLTFLFIGLSALTMMVQRPGARKVTADAH